MWLSCFPVLPGSAEAQVIWGGIVKRLLIAYFIGNISAEKYQNSFMCDKVIASQRLDIFWDTVYCSADSDWCCLFRASMSCVIVMQVTHPVGCWIWLLAAWRRVLVWYLMSRQLNVTRQRTFVAMESCICHVIFRAIFTSAQKFRGPHFHSISQDTQKSTAKRGELMRREVRVTFVNLPAIFSVWHVTWDAYFIRRFMYWQWTAKWYSCCEISLIRNIE